jgi:hypothetical protein
VKTGYSGEIFFFYPAYEVSKGRRSRSNLVINFCLFCGGKSDKRFWETNVPVLIIPGCSIKKCTIYNVPYFSYSKSAIYTISQENS